MDQRRDDKKANLDRDRDRDSDKSERFKRLQEKREQRLQDKAADR